MAVDSTLRCVADVGAILGEGPIWVVREAALYWLDIKGRKIFRLDGNEALTEWPTPMRIGSLAPRRGGGFIGGTEDGIAEIDPAAGRFTIIADPEADLPENRFNDGKLDRQGRFWAGTMDDREEAASGTLYRIDPDLKINVCDRGYRVTNGPAFSPDGKVMYHNDSGLQTTYRFDIDPDGQARGRSVFLKFREGEGFPDGMTVDSEGCLWIAFWDGWCVRRYSPRGEWLQTLQMPVARPTSCAFGGPRLDQLYISSASIDLDQRATEMQPNAGGLFMVRPGVGGIEEVPFAG